MAQEKASPLIYTQPLLQLPQQFSAPLSHFAHFLVCKALVFILISLIVSKVNKLLCTVKGFFFFPHVFQTYVSRMHLKPRKASGQLVPEDFKIGDLFL